MAVFGDAYISNTNMEGPIALPRSFKVLNYILKSAVRSRILSPATGLEEGLEANMSQVARTLQASEDIIAEALKVSNQDSVFSFIRIVKQKVETLPVGDSLVLPVAVEGIEFLMLLDKLSASHFTVVVIQTDPNSLRHHVASATIAPPDIHYRTCMVLNDVPTANVLDNVFWLALYNLKVNVHPGDMARFYDILLPFLTGKPLDVSLLEAERAAQGLSKLAVDESTIVKADMHTSFPTLSGAPAGVAVAGVTTGVAAAAVGEVEKVEGEADYPHMYGSFAAPLHSQTHYTRLYMEALTMLLRLKGLSEERAQQVGQAYLMD